MILTRWGLSAQTGAEPTNIATLWAAWTSLPARWAKRWAAHPAAIQRRKRGGGVAASTFAALSLLQFSRAGHCGGVFARAGYVDGRKRAAGAPEREHALFPHGDGKGGLLARGRRSRHHSGYAGRGENRAGICPPVAAGRDLRDRLFLPVVPKGRARIRTQISAGHSREQLERAVAAFTRVGRDLGVIHGEHAG